MSETNTTAATAIDTQVTMTPEQILVELKTIAPHIAFRIGWSPDHDAKPFQDCLDYFEPWVVIVEAVAVCNGDLIIGKSYMGEHYERPGEHNVNNLDGYLLQLTDEAVADLSKKISTISSAYLSIVSYNKFRRGNDKHMLSTLP